MNERDSHFAGFAKLQMPELDSLFAMLYQAYATGDTAKRDEYSQRIETYLTQRAYDLAYHVLDSIAVTDYGSEGTPINWVFNPEDIPDLTAWPNTSPQSS